MPNEARKADEAIVHFTQKPLRIVAPGLYQQMIKVLDEHQIHPYDVDASAIVHQSEVEIILQYGDSYTQSDHLTVSDAVAKKPNAETKQFFQEAVEKIKKQLIADYFKMVKP